MLSANEHASSTALDWIASTAEVHEASVLSKSDTTLIVVVRLRRADGHVSPYNLAVTRLGLGVRVKEVEPNRLPASCPERHINGDGTFCTHWAKVHPRQIVTEEAAVLWWQELLGYLKLQERAANLREWPSKIAWAHGDAADYQRVAEDAASALGPKFAHALSQSRLKVKKSRANGAAFYALFDGSKRLYSIWRHFKRVATLRQYCVCGSGELFKNCKDHAASAVLLVEALVGWDKAEKQFWGELKKQKCCGTMDNCPLRSAA